MKCIKNKCKYYQPDMFKASYFRCILEDAPFKNEVDVDCIIEKSIMKLVERSNKLREYKKKIKKINDEKVITMPSLVGKDDYARAGEKERMNSE